MLFKYGIVKKRPPSQAAVAPEYDVIPIVREIPHYILPRLKPVAQGNRVPLRLLLDLRLGAVELL